MSKIDEHHALQDSMNERMFCSNINNPHAYVTVLNVVRASNGYSVLFSAGEGHAVFCGYKRFLKRFPHEVVSFVDSQGVANEQTNR